MKIKISDIRGFPEAIRAMLAGDAKALKRAIEGDDKDPPRGGSAAVEDPAP